MSITQDVSAVHATVIYNSFFFAVEAVLKDLDFRMFTVGAETECCQRMGAPGEEAAVDSFINPLAGVLICERDGNIISQSYFHYVPSDKGFILDNIEWNEKGIIKYKLDGKSLAKIYASWAEEMKDKNKWISYIKCGLDYNKIDNDLFTYENMKKDPRSFSVSDPYSDFNAGKHINLLKPIKSVIDKIASFFNRVGSLLS